MESGDPSLDGPVQGVVEMVEKLAGVKEPSESLSDMSSAFGSVEMKRLMTLQFRGKRAGGIKKVVAAARHRCFPLFRLLVFVQKDIIPANDETNSGYPVRSDSTVLLHHN